MGSSASDRDTSYVPAILTIGGGSVVVFALVWMLIKLTGERAVTSSVGLPLIVLVGVIVLLIVIALVTFTFSSLGLASPREALGLPDGSIRAIMALMLLVLFSIVSIFLYDSIASRPLQTAEHVTQAQLDDMRRQVTVVVTQAEAGSNPAAFRVMFRETNGPADDIAKQLIVLLGTLVTAVASFYFGSASVASASAAALAQKVEEPSATAISPDPIAAGGGAQALTIVGSGLGNVGRLHLERKGQADIDAASVKATDTSVTAQITLPAGSQAGRWDVVANDGASATTIGSITVLAAAADAAAAEPASASLEEEMLLAEDAALPVPPILTMPATINPAFLGHGMFLEYSPLTTLHRYRDYKGQGDPNAGTAQLVAKFIQAMQDMHVGSVWIQLFSASGNLDPAGHNGTRELVDGLKAAGIACVGWGYCYSGNAATDAGLAKHLCGQYGIDAFIADVEPGNTVHGSPDTWDKTAFRNLIAGLKENFGKDGLGVSTFGTLKGHDDAAAIYRLAAPDVALFAPQMYWYAHPPVAYAQASIASFRKAGITNPLVATTQSYWEIDKNGGVSRERMEAQVKAFVTGFADWGKLAGLNWYHAGNANTDASGAMSDVMIATIAAANLQQKPYAAPAGAAPAGAAPAVVASAWAQRSVAC